MRHRLRSALDRWRFFLTGFASKRGAIVLGALYGATAWAFGLRRAWVLGDLPRPAGGCRPVIPDGVLPPLGPAKVLEAIECLPNQGIYALSEITLDVWFPLLYITLLGTILVAITRRAERPATCSLLLPLGMATCDVIENLAYASIAASSAGTGVATIATIAAWGKWLLLGATLTAIAFLGRHLPRRWLGYLMAIRSRSSAS